MPTDQERARAFAAGIGWDELANRDGCADALADLLTAIRQDERHQIGRYLARLADHGLVDAALADRVARGVHQEETG